MMNAVSFCLMSPGNYQSHLIETDSETNSKGPVLARRPSSCNIYVEFKTVFKLEKNLCENNSSTGEIQSNSIIVIFVNEK